MPRPNLGSLKPSSLKRKLSGRRAETVVAAALALGTVAIATGREHDPPPGPRHLALEKIGRFDEPIHIAQPPKEDDLLFVIEKRGVVRVVRDGEKLDEPFLDLKRDVLWDKQERGMYSIAFAPDYPSSRRFYVTYMDRRNNFRLDEFQRSPVSDVRAVKESRRRVMTVPHPSADHHGGLLLFGPDDLLYVGSGDGGPSFDPFDTGQNTGTLLGKILRIDPRPAGGRPYKVPKDNPFAESAAEQRALEVAARRRPRKQGRPVDPTRDEIYAYGLRNPWRFSFDRANGGLSVGDVGQDRFEEINYLPAGKARGANFGWSAFEGYASFKGGVPKRQTVIPSLVYPHGPGCSVTGGYVVRDPSLTPIKGREIIGRYLFGDYCTGDIFQMRLRPGRRSSRDLGLPVRKVPLLTSFGEDRDGHIYALSEEGPVYRLVARARK